MKTNKTTGGAGNQLKNCQVFEIATQVVTQNP